MVPMLTPCDIWFSHNTLATNRQTTDRQTDTPYARLDLTVG